MKLLVKSRLPSKWGEYTMAAYGEEGDRYPHVVLYSDLEQLKRGRVPLRIHSECMTGDVFASRGPDPVLQQVEDFGDATVSANDCFRPVSRYYDRIARPEHLLTALPRAFRTMTDPADCGPVTLGFCQDVQAEAFDWPEGLFEPRVWRQRRVRPDARELDAAVEAIRAARAPMIIAGGGIHYSGAAHRLQEFASEFAIPVAETQAGKSALAHDHPLNAGSIGVTGAAAANAIASQADLVIAIGTGPGVVLVLRWFWWRINAAAELAAMVCGFVVGLCTSVVPLLVIPDYGIRLMVTTGITAVVWITVMLCTPPESSEVMERFVRQVQPPGPGWRRWRERYAVQTVDSLGALISRFLLSSAVLFGALLGSGAFLLHQSLTGWLGLALAVVCGLPVLRSYGFRPGPS